jgi:hypothetical protein
MPYQPYATYLLPPDPARPKFARPRREASDGTYEIRLIRAEDPAYIPSDLEAWPIYYQAILSALLAHPEAQTAAVAAIRETRHRLTGLQNADVPPGTMPW